MAFFPEMAREKNLVTTETVQISLSVVTWHYLADLVFAGGHGKNRAEAAQGIVESYVNGMVREGRIQPRTALPSERIMEPPGPSGEPPGADPPASS
jgi:hypothetical protein